MKYVVVALLMLVLVYLYSFSWHNWRNQNKLAAVGAALLATVAGGFWYFLLFLGNFEL